MDHLPKRDRDAEILAEQVNPIRKRSEYEGESMHPISCKKYLVRVPCRSFKVRQLLSFG